MSKMIQIRHVPDRLHRLLKVRAARAGQSLSDYLLGELEQVARQLTLDEVEERLAQAERVTLRESPARAIRAARDHR